MEKNDRAAATAVAILKFRRVRSKLLLRELFAEPGWDLLLELFVADANGHRLTARDVSNRANISPLCYPVGLYTLLRSALSSATATATSTTY